MGVLGTLAAYVDLIFWDPSYRFYRGRLYGIFQLAQKRKSRAGDFTPSLRVWEGSGVELVMNISEY